MSAETVWSRSRARGAWPLLLALALGCEASTSGIADERSRTEPAVLAPAGEELGIGSQGADVIAVHAYLARFGYLPSERLASVHPGSRPVVADSPAHDDVFDETSAAAVAAYQRRMSLPQTGVVDADTRAQMRLPRCGNPDSSDRFEPIAKFGFSRVNPPIDHVFIRWQYSASSDSLTPKQVKAAITAACAAWAKTTAVTFLEAAVGEQPDIKFVWGQLDNPNALAETAPEAANPSIHRVTIAVDKEWSVASPTPATAFDLQSTLLHEIGHAIGISHTSNYVPAVMWPSIALAERKRALTEEDAIPASVLYDQFEVLTAAGFAQDIAVSASGIAWVIGTTCSGGDCEIKKLNNSTSAWETADSSGIRIDVTSSGVPWMIKSNGNIYKRSGATALTGKWTQVAGCAKDISIGADNSVWILGCESAYGGYSIKRWNASSKTWEVADGVAVRIAVGPDGIPAVVTPDGWIYVRSEASALTGTWSSQSTLGMGALPDANTDLTFDNFAYWYRIGVNDTPAVFSLNQDGSTQTRGPYELFPGACKAISVGKLPSGNQGVWLVGTDGAVRRPTK